MRTGCSAGIPAVKSKRPHAAYICMWSLEWEFRSLQRQSLLHECYKLRNLMAIVTREIHPPGTFYVGQKHRYAVHQV